MSVSFPQRSGDCQVFAMHYEDIRADWRSKTARPIDSGMCVPAIASLKTYYSSERCTLAYLQLDLPRWSPSGSLPADKTKLQGFIIRPPGFDPAKKYPVKFLIHGGPQGAWGDSWSYRWNAELFAANGYVVVMINPRGSTGYGQAIVDGVNGDWGGKPFTDLMEGLDYAEQHYPSSTRTASARWGRATAGTWLTGCWGTPTASSAL